MCIIAVRPECKSITFVSEASVYDSPSVEVTVDDLSMENVNYFCFLLTGINSTKRVNVEGQYNISGNENYVLNELIYIILLYYSISYGYQSLSQKSDTSCLYYFHGVVVCVLT